MQHRLESSSKRRDRRRRGQDFDAAMRGSPSGIDPPVEGEGENPIGGDQLRRPLLAEDDRSKRETFDLGSPGAAPLPGQTAIHLSGGWSPTQCRLIGLVLLASTETTGSVSRSQCDSVIEEEDRRPGPRGVERVLPAAKLQFADDPEVAAMMTHDLALVVDQATSIAREGSSRRHRVEFTKGIDPITKQ